MSWSRGRTHCCDGSTYQRRCPGADRDAVRAAMSVDKKTASGAIRWVLLEGVGRSVTRNDVPSEIVEDALAAVT